jgi:hypothetical protein
VAIAKETADKLIIESELRTGRRRKRGKREKANCSSMNEPIHQ